MNKAHLHHFAQVLRGYHGMGLPPNMLEDTGGKPWESLPPEVLEKWLAYAAQVVRSVELIDEPAGLPPDAETLASPEWRETFTGLVAARRHRQAEPVRRYFAGTLGGNWQAVEKDAHGVETCIDTGVPFNPGVAVTLQWPGPPPPVMFGCIRCGGTFGDTPGARDEHSRGCPGAVEQPACTGVAASWCPIHGDCRCPRAENGERLEDCDDCPLHSSTSTHGDDEADARQEQVERERREAEVVRKVERILAGELQAGKQLVCQRCAKTWEEGKLTPCSSPWKAEHGEHDWLLENVRPSEVP